MRKEEGKEGNGGRTYEMELMILPTTNCQYL
jgi:hypothetical protein